MLQIDRADVTAAPFPHVVKHGILPADLFAELKADFPTAALFADQFGETGATGSRVGAGTGFDIYRGDTAYDRLIAQSPTWAKFDAYINSAAFVDTFMEVFGDDLDALGCSITVDPHRYDRDEIEPRETLKPTKTLRERLSAFIPRRGGDRGEAPELFTRLDIEKSLVGYHKPPHCDRENRLCSLIIYFTDLEAKGVKGGDLNIYAHRTKKAPRDHERHPQPSSVDVVATLAPKENLGVFFPCSSNSYHGVNAVETQGVARDFLYINISAVAPTCW